ncbi:MAG: ABC transporter substrate-binding protein [Erysipelotrichaceae bacterium]|nr:ABC transporter substrate-binding protein [Erysipelotrichaceae bacterium]
MKKLLKIALTLMLVTGCSKQTINETNDDKPVIGIVQLVEHTSLNIIKDAILDQLDTLGYKDSENCVIKFVNAQGDVANLPTIMQNLKAENVDVVVAITTPVAQAALSLSSETPIIFSAISDPVGANVVKALDDTSDNVTGTSDPVKVKQIIDLALTIDPEAKTVGYIYNAGEDNSVSNLKILQEYALEKGLTVETATISVSSELQTASSVIANKVDFIFVPTDNTVAEAMAILASEGIKANIPVYVGADSMVMDGGLATVGIDYSDLGIETANMVDKVLKGTLISDIPVETFDSNLSIYINKNTLESLGITLPESIANDPKLIEIGE